MVAVYELDEQDGSPLTVGCDGGWTVACTFTVTESVALPPGPVQFKVYVCELVRPPVDCEPDVPDQPVGETEHEVALFDVHEIVADVPD